MADSALQQRRVDADTRCGFSFSESSHLEVLVASRSPEATSPSVATDVCRQGFHPDAASVAANAGVFADLTVLYFRLSLLMLSLALVT